MAFVSHMQTAGFLMTRLIVSNTEVYRGIHYLVLLLKTLSLGIFGVTSTHNLCVDGPNGYSNSVLYKEFFI